MDKRILMLLCFSSAITFASLGMTRPLVVLLANSLGASAVLVGFIVALYAFIPFFLALHVGTATDRFGPRPVIMVGSLGFALSMLIVAVRPTLVGLIASQTLAGLFQLCCVLAFQTYVSSIGKRDEMERNFGWYTTFVSVGQLLGPLLGGTLTDTISYQAAFYGSALLSVLAIALVLPLPRTDGQRDSRVVSGVEFSKVRNLLTRSGVKAAMLSSFAVLFTLGARQAFFPLFLQGFGYTATSIGVLASIRAAAAMVTRPFLPNVVSLSGSRLYALVLTISLAAVGLIVTPLGHSFLFFAVVSSLVGIGTGLCQPLSMLIVADDSSPEERGLAMGLRLMGNRLAQVVNPLLFGVVADVAGLAAAFITGGGLLLVSGAVLLRWRNAFPVVRREKKLTA